MYNFFNQPVNYLLYCDSCRGWQNVLLSAPVFFTFLERYVYGISLLLKNKLFLRTGLNSISINEQFSRTSRSLVNFGFELFLSPCKQKAIYRVIPPHVETTSIFSNCHTRIWIERLSWAEPLENLCETNQEMSTRRFFVTNIMLEVINTWTLSRFMVQNKNKSVTNSKIKKI